MYMVRVLRQIRPLLTLKAQNSNYYASCSGIKMRSGQYTSPCQDTKAGEGYQESRPPVY
jgi:hypothetical protein